MNDSDIDNDTLAIKSFTQGALGKVTQAGNKLIYTPDASVDDIDTLRIQLKMAKVGKPPLHVHPHFEETYTSHEWTSSWFSTANNYEEQQN